MTDNLGNTVPNPTSGWALGEEKAGLRHKVETLEQALSEANENADLIAQSLKDVGCYVQCCEGGGPENVQGSLAISVAKLKDKVQRLQNGIREHQMQRAGRCGAQANWYIADDERLYKLI